MSVQMQQQNFENTNSNVHVKMMYQGVELQNNQDQENIIRYVPTRREVDSLVIDNYLFQRVSASTNKDGSIGWRCKEYRRQNKCQSTCRISATGQIIRRPGPHNHERESDAGLAFMQAKRNAKIRCRSENNLPVEKIFLQEISKAIINNSLNLTQEDIERLPRFQANKRCLQIQRKIGIEKSRVSDHDNDSYTETNNFISSDENSEQPAFLDTVTELLKIITPQHKRKRTNSMMSQLSVASSDDSSVKDEPCYAPTNLDLDTSSVKVKNPTVKKRKTMSTIKETIDNSETMNNSMANNVRSTTHVRKRAKTIGSIDQISLNIQKKLGDVKQEPLLINNDQPTNARTPIKSDRSPNKFCNVTVTTPIRKKKNRINNLMNDLWHLKEEISY